MRSKPLALTDEQFKLVFAAAKSVPVEWRDRFLADCSDRLSALEQFTDEDVRQTVSAVLVRTTDTAPLPNNCRCNGCE